MRYRLSALTAVLAALMLCIPSAHAADQVITGEGSATAPLARITQSVIVEITMSGDGAVQAKPVLSNGGRTFPWVDTTGPWAGTVFQEKEVKPIVGAKVSTTGPWTITVKPLSSAPRVTRGTTSMVISLKKATRGSVTKKFTYRGQGDFKVFPISRKGVSGFASIEESGPYSGKVSLPYGTKYIAITASGPWTMK